HRRRLRSFPTRRSSDLLHCASAGCCAAAIVRTRAGEDGAVVVRSPQLETATTAPTSRAADIQRAVFMACTLLITSRRSGDWRGGDRKSTRLNSSHDQTS